MTKYILIVDPSISFAVSLKRALEDTGEYAVRTVARIKPAIAALQETPHQLAVIDLDLDFASPSAMVRAIRTIQPEIPVIVAGVHNEDRPAVEELNAQAFIKKPFLAKDLIPLIEETIQRGYDSHEIATQKNLAQELEAREKEDLVDPLLEASRKHPDRDLVEPPITADDSTISEVISQALNPEVSRKIYTQSETQPAMPSNSAFEAPRDHMDETTPALETLSATLGTASLDSLLEEIRDYASGQANALADAMSADKTDSGPPLAPIPTDEETRDQGIPMPPRLPELYDDAQVQTEIPDEDVPEMTEEPYEDLSIEDDDLVPTTVEQMTERLTIVELEEIEQELASKADSERIDEKTMAR
jgi:ActR/RegA family two-component response regulator